MRLEQTELSDFLPEDERGTTGEYAQFIKLPPIKAWILRQLYLSGAMTSAELIGRIPPEAKAWSKSGVSGRLSELTNPKLRLVEARYIPGHQHRMYAITRLGRRAIRGLPI